MDNKKPVRLSTVAVLVVVLLLCVGAYLLATRIVDARSNQLRDIVSTPASANNTIKPFGSGLLYYDGGSLHAIDSRGRQVWAYPAGSLAKYDVSDGGVVTWSGSMLSLLNSQNGTASYSGNEKGTIIAAKLGKKYAAIQIENTQNANKALTDAEREHDSVMIIRDHSGNQIDSLALENQTVLDFGFFSGDQLLWTLSLNTEGTVPVCMLNTYKPSKMTTGTIEDPEQVIYESLFLSSKIRTVGRTYIKDYDYKNSKEIAANRMLVYGWYMLDVDESSQDPMMVFVPDGQANGNAVITDLRTIHGQTDVTVRLPSAAKQVFVKGTTVYAFATDRVMVAKQGDPEPLTYSLPIIVDNVIDITDNNSAIIVSGNSVYIIRMV